MKASYVNRNHYVYKHSIVNDPKLDNKILMFKLGPLVSNNTPINT